MTDHRTALSGTRTRFTGAAAAFAVGMALGLASTPGAFADDMSIDERLAMYTEVTLTTDLSHLSERELAVVDRLIGAAQIMDRLFWRQSCCLRDQFLTTIDDPQVREFARINYGPWDRLNGNEPFVEGTPAKPDGAGFYPADMTREELAMADLPAQWKRSPYALISRTQYGDLSIVPYHVNFGRDLQEAAALLREAASLSDNASFSRYLELRADALLDSEYQASDFAWMDVEDNSLDVVIGPIETYEDKLLGIRTSFEAYVLVKDPAWSQRLARYAGLLPLFQRMLPVPDAYRAEEPGSDAELNVYDVVYYAGEANAGSKTIAINLPNDEQVQLQKGTRRLMLKNALQAKFDRILVPISDLLIAEDQREHVTADAFFANVLFHEVAHGLGVKNLVDGEGTVKGALQDAASAIEEGKADILGLYMVTLLALRDELPDGELMDSYVSFLASIFRSVRFGAASAHGKANMVAFNFLQDAGAFARDEVTGTWRVDYERMQAAITALAQKLLMLQGDGDREGARALLAEQGAIGPVLQADLDRVAEAGIPRDIIFEQGRDVLGLTGRDLPTARAD